MPQVTNPLAATPMAFNRLASASNPALGPLATLVIGETWIGDSGFNLMVVPKPGQGFLVMLSPLFETDYFEAVPAPVPNRGGTVGTEQIGAVKYSQTVAENVSKNILHEETGMWMNQTLGTATGPTDFGLQMVSGQPASAYVTTNPIVRSGTIPHGITIQATGVWQTYDAPTSGNVLPYIGLNNFQNNGSCLQFLPVYADNSDPSDLQAEYKNQIAAAIKLLNRPDLTVDDFINPIGFLNVKANYLASVTSMVVTTSGKKGGVLNIPFENAFAGPTEFNCTFMIETIKNPDFSAVEQSSEDEVATYFQLQYLQNIPLLIPKAFNGKDVVFPHWNVNTLIAI